mgnify:CR=1 FL=1|jgi:glycosyltransferase involved in cell wall biosynthesis
MKFSVSICVYYKDDPVYFNDALKSIIKQTVLPAEIVLVIDGWVGDKILKVVSYYEKEFENFKVIKLKENVGHGQARKICIDNCSYDFVALMDSDDISVEDRFEAQIQSFENDGNLSVVGGWIDEFRSDDLVSFSKRILPANDSEIKQYMKYRCPMNQVTVMLKKVDLLKAGGYLDWHHEEDYYLWLRMHLSGCKFKNIQRILVHVRADDDYFSRRGGGAYFLSETRLQKYMYSNGIINFGQFIVNVILRFFIQVVIPNSLRGFVYNFFLRRDL